MLRCTSAYFNTLLALCAVLLAGCTALSPYSHVTKLDLTLSASDQVNPDLHGRPSPVVIRLLELKHPVAFENADFSVSLSEPKNYWRKTWLSVKNSNYGLASVFRTNSVLRRAAAMWASWRLIATCHTPSGAT